MLTINITVDADTTMKRLPYLKKKNTKKVHLTGQHLCMNIVRQCHMMLWSSMRESIQVFFKGGLKDNHYCVSCIDKLKVLYQSKMKFASNGHLPSFIFLILWNKYPFPKIHNIHNAGILDLFKLSRLRAWNFALNSLIKLFLRTLPSYDHSINIKTYNLLKQRVKLLIIKTTCIYPLRYAKG